MRVPNRSWLVASLILPILAAFPARTQTQTQASTKTGAASADADTQNKNLQEYVELLRTDVRQQKAEIMGAVMLLSADDATKFWPIYSEYDAELSKLNDQRIENIKEYARAYNQMTDEKADELIQKSLGY